MGVAGWRGGTKDRCPGRQKPSRRHWFLVSGMMKSWSTRRGNLQATTMNEQQLLDIVLPPSRRRSSSLRRAKSPGSPTDQQRKKVVHFADALGLDLRSVRHLDRSAAPVVPDTALRDMRRGMEEAHKTEGTRYVCACFTQPGDASDFLQRVNSNAVVLERYCVQEFDVVPY